MRERTFLVEEPHGFHPTATVPRTYKLEAAVAHHVTSQTPAPSLTQKSGLHPEVPSQEQQQLKDLQHQVLSVHTPEVLCQIVKKEEEPLGMTKKMIHLAKTADRLSQIYKTFDPKSNIYLDPKPMDPNGISALVALLADAQKERINQFWEDIVTNCHCHKDNGRCTLFELEHRMEAGDTYEEKSHILHTGQLLKASLKKSKSISLIRSMSIRKKSRTGDSKSNTKSLMGIDKFAE